jgi:hypothetical protein
MLLPHGAVEKLTTSKAGRSSLTQLEDAIRNGFVEPVGAVSHINPDIVIPGVFNSKLPSIVADPDGSDPRKPTPERYTVQTSSGGISTSASLPPEVPESTEAVAAAVKTGWAVGDDAIAGRSLVELNGMIVERLPLDERAAFQPYATVEEAVAHLQQDIE